MKSYGIKTQNEQMATYLLNEISKIEFPNIYYCSKSFRIYENVLLHYKEEKVEEFMNIVSEILTNTVIEFYQESIISRIINVNYFYFDNFERNIINEECLELLKQDEEEIRESIFNKIKKYIECNRNIVLEGVVNFRLQEYIKILDNIVDIAVNKYIIEKEYKEFIGLLKTYVNSTPPQTDLMHLIYINGESILLDKDKKVIQVDCNINNAKYLSDISFSSNDIALNTLLSLIPKKIQVHLITKGDEFINTLKTIFENRVEFCTECNICKTYKSIKNIDNAKISK